MYKRGVVRRTAHHTPLLLQPENIPSIFSNSPIQPLNGAIYRRRQLFIAFAVIVSAAHLNAERIDEAAAPVIEIKSYIVT